MKRESAQNLVPEEVIIVARVAKAMLAVINARMFTLLGMILSACAFGYVLWQPDWIRFAAACAFAALVYLPIIRIEQRKQENENEG